MLIAPYNYERKSTLNTSGNTGVGYCKTRQKWTSVIIIDKKRIGFKRFDKKEDAIKHRKKLEVKYNTEHWSLKFLNKYELLST